MLRLTAILIFAWSSIVHADISKDQFDALYSSFNISFTKETYGDGMHKIKKDFYRSVPEADQVDVLAELIERASTIPQDSPVVMNAMNLADLHNLKHAYPWNERLEIALLPQVKNSDLEVRKRLVSIFLIHPESGHHDAIIPVIKSILRESDEQLRFATLNEVVSSKWPEAKEICEDYIKDTQPESSYKDSVLVARAFTNPEDSKRAISLSLMKAKPDAQKTYLSFISSHKDDPDYAVSVDMAE